jgi:two-component system, chemotaxis family, protein-glutamate methylesterase/glutaminase
MSNVTSSRIKVLVVEDVRVVREMLVAVLDDDPGLCVVGAVNDGADALEAVQRLRPDVITMDVHMPRMNGYEATRQIMESCPTPIVIVSGSTNPREVETTFRAIEAGAVAMLERPPGPGHPQFESKTRDLIRTVKSMAEVKVVRRWAKRATAATAPVKLAGVTRDAGLVAIGGSTGAPLVLKTILSALPKDFPVPVIIVQHMAAGFIAGFAEWLSATTGFAVQLARDRETMRPGHAYVAPDGFHLAVREGDVLRLENGVPQAGLRPAVAHLFRSLASAHGRRVVAVLLSGMGADGSAEMKVLHDLGALTLVQDRETSVVFGMPGEAVRLGGARHVLPPDALAEAIVKAVTKEVKS